MVTTTRMKRITMIMTGIVILAMMSGLVISCGEKSQQQEQPTPTPAAAKATTSGSGTQSAGEALTLQMEWPPGVGEQEVDLEENLLAANYYVIFDGSGSMKGDKLRVAKQALSEFVKYIPGGANVGLAAFDQYQLAERAVLGESRDSVIAQIDKVQAKGSTPLKDSITLAYRRLTTQGLKQLGYGEYHLVVITDGEASDGQDPTGVVNTILQESPVVIHTIGFQIGQDHSLNQPGKILYVAANNLEELQKGLESVLAELEDFSVADFQE
jgi:uncharacterized protein YegL